MTEIAIIAADGTVTFGDPIGLVIVAIALLVLGGCAHKFCADLFPVPKDHP